jgi:hypothetical protein
MTDAMVKHLVQLVHSLSTALVVIQPVLRNVLDIWRIRRSKNVREDLSSDLGGGFQQKWDQWKVNGE